MNRLLAEQVTFLRRSAEAYDLGDLSEAKRLATTVSTLVNTTRNAQALLTQMGVRDTIPFLSFAEPLEYRFPKLCLVVVEASSETGVRFLPICHSQFAKYLPSALVPFEQWWTAEPVYEVVLEDGSTGTLNRLDIVRYLRCQDGGSHIDVDLTSEEYVLLSRIAETGIYGYSDGQMVGIVVTATEGAKPIIDGHLAAMRQIAYELEQSLIQAGLVQPPPQPEASV